jgi:hypothetical protein
MIYPAGNPTIQPPFWVSIHIKSPGYGIVRYTHWMPSGYTRAQDCVLIDDGWRMPVTHPQPAQTPEG